MTPSQPLGPRKFGEALDYPALNINIDRIRAGQLGVTVDQVARALVAATSSSRFTSPNYWLDKSTGTAYQVQAEVPQSEMQSPEDVKAIPAILNPDSKGPFIRDVATIEPGMAVGEAHRLNNQRILTLTANIQGDDLKQAAQAMDPEIFSRTDLSLTDAIYLVLLNAQSGLVLPALQLARLFVVFVLRNSPSQTFVPSSPEL